MAPAVWARTYKIFFNSVIHIWIFFSIWLPFTGRSFSYEAAALKPVWFSVFERFLSKEFLFNSGSSCLQSPTTSGIVTSTQSKTQTLGAPASFPESCWFSETCRSKSTASHLRVCKYCTGHLTMQTPHWPDHVKDYIFLVDDKLQISWLGKLSLK